MISSVPVLQYIGEVSTKELVKISLRFLRFSEELTPIFLIKLLGYKVKNLNSVLVIRPNANWKVERGAQATFEKSTFPSIP